MKTWPGRPTRRTSTTAAARRRTRGAALLAEKSRACSSRQGALGGTPKTSRLRSAHEAARGPREGSTNVGRRRRRRCSPHSTSCPSVTRGATARRGVSERTPGKVKTRRRTRADPAGRAKAGCRDPHHPDAGGGGGARGGVTGPAAAARRAPRRGAERHRRASLRGRGWHDPSARENSARENVRKRRVTSHIPARTNGSKKPNAMVAVSAPSPSRARPSPNDALDLAVIDPADPAAPPPRRRRSRAPRRAPGGASPRERGEPLPKTARLQVGARRAPRREAHFRTKRPHAHRRGRGVRARRVRVGARRERRERRGGGRAFWHSGGAG